MKQDSKDIVISAATEWTQYEVRMNFDSDCREVVHQMATLLKSMTFTTGSIINALRDVADDLEEDVKCYTKYNLTEEDYGTTD